MRTNINTDYILDLNRRFHDEVEAETYDARMGTSHDIVSCEHMIQELETVLGSKLPRGGRVVDAACGTGNVAIKSTNCRTAYRFWLLKTNLSH